MKGFRITIEDVLYEVYFVIWDTNVKCIIKNDFAEKFEAIAKCHPEDEFSKKEGQLLSLERAIEKIQRKLSLQKKWIDKEFDREIDSTNKLYNKLLKIQNKGWI